MRLQLVIANKNYSSWSMRPWIALRQAGIDFDEVQLKFTDEGKVRGIEAWPSPNGQVPLLLMDGVPVWDSLAICETLAELHPQLWPADARTRRLARAACAEMHGGFRALRSAMPMNIRAAHPGKGMSAGVQRDIDRVCAMWRSCREFGEGGGDMLFDAFSVADAYFAPVVMRFMTYAVALPADAQRYCDAVRQLVAVREWMDGARAETEFVPADEPYAQSAV
jgi:glutathione S-transferase